MQTKHLATWVVVVLLVVTPFFTQALTSEEKNTFFLQQLITQVLELQKQIIALGGTSVTIPSNLSIPAGEGSDSMSVADQFSSCTISRTLTLGARGEEVKCLQTRLISQNLLAPDSATGYFGPLTEQAVQRFQTTHSIASSGTPQTTGFGLVGKLTRAAITTVRSATTGTSTGSNAAITSALENGTSNAGGTVAPPPPLSSGDGGDSSPTSTPSDGGGDGGAPSASTDTIVPTVAITAPTASSTVSGVITITASASDNVGVVGVQFKLDDANFGAEDVTASYSIQWNTASTTNGTHMLAAVARDTAGNRATSTVSVTVSNVATQPPGTPSITVLAPIAQSKMYFNDWAATPVMNVEITPWALGSGRMGGWHSFLVSTDVTYLCATPDNMFALTAEKSIKDAGACHYKEGAALTAANVGQANTLPMWKRDYYGAMSAHILKIGASDLTAYMINHGEMENSTPRGLSYCVSAPDMGYGALPCTAANWWPSYNAFIGMSSFPWTKAGLADNGSLTTDYGPIAWPANGYIESKDGGTTWIKATDGGVRTPSSIIKDGYLYVYYEDLSQGSQSEGRGAGLKLMRAPITSSGIDPKSFRTYYDGAFTDLALPSGYDITNYYTKWSAKGGRASNIFPHEPVKLVAPTPGTKRTDQRQIGEVSSFSVAKIQGTTRYLGVGYELSKGVTLRLSSDLIHWSDPVVIPGTGSNYWTGTVDLQRVPLLYPHLANADGDSNVDIDPNDFYVIGTQTAQYGATEAKVVNAIHLKLNL